MERDRRNDAWSRLLLYAVVAYLLLARPAEPSAAEAREAERRVRPPLAPQQRPPRPMRLLRAPPDGAGALAYVVRALLRARLAAR